MQIGILLGGAAVNTTLGPSSQLESCLLLGDVDTTNPLQGIKVNIDGKTTIDIQNAALVNAFSKFMNQLSAAVIGLTFVLATGRIRKNTTVTLTNAGATTPIIYGYSPSQNGVAIEAQTQNINALSNETFKDFTALQVFVTNVASFDVVFADGTPQNMTPIEMDALFVMGNSAEANGRLDPSVTTIDNRGKLFKEVKVNTTSGGSCTLTLIKLPDAYFASLQK